MNPLPLPPEEMAQDWLAETKLERLQSCRIFLHLHGMLTPIENFRIKQRLKQNVRSRSRKIQMNGAK